MDTIFIQDLRLETRIGVYEWEQHLAQPLLLNIELQVPSAKPFASDKLADAVNYAAIVERLQALAADHPHKLLERFSDAVAEIVRSEFGAPWVKVSVAKLAPMPGVKQIGVRVERGTKTST
jgi:dihydroneopterin aldolase